MSEDQNRSVHDPYAPQGRVVGPTDDMQRRSAPDPDPETPEFTDPGAPVTSPDGTDNLGQPGADEDGFGGDAPEPEAAPNDGTVKDLVAEAKDDPELAAEIVEAEHELPEDEQRTTLLDKLEPVAEEAVPEGNAGDVLKWVGTDKDRAQRALDAENAGQQRKGLTNDLTAIVSAE